MTTLVLIVIGFAIIAWLEIPGMIEKKYWKELVVFSVLLLAVFSLTLLYAMGIKLPNPNNAAYKAINYFAQK